MCNKKQLQTNEKFYYEIQLHGPKFHKILCQFMHQKYNKQKNTVDNKVEKKKEKKKEKKLTKIANKLYTSKQNLALAEIFNTALLT